MQTKKKHAFLKTKWVLSVLRAKQKTGIIIGSLREKSASSEVCVWPIIEKTWQIIRWHLHWEKHEEFHNKFCASFCSHISVKKVSYLCIRLQLFCGIIFFASLIMVRVALLPFPYNITFNNNDRKVRQKEGKKRGGSVIKVSPLQISVSLP